MASKQLKSELRILLIGKTGGGKTSAMNTLLGSPCLTPLSASSGTIKCQMKRGACGDQPLVVIDTPGVVHTELSPEVQIEEMVKCMVYASPGPHVFLYVQKADRLTQEDSRAMKIIQEVFGPESKSHTLVLFTNGDREAEEISEEHKSFVRKVSYGSTSENYHFFDKPGKGEPNDQVPKLLEKINKMVLKNEEKPYTNEMLKQVVEVVKKKKEEEGVASNDATSDATSDFLHRVVTEILGLTMGEECAKLALKLVKGMVKKLDEQVSLCNCQ